MIAQRPATVPPKDHLRFQVRIADEEDRKKIYLVRHAVYAKELRQHSENDEFSLRDSLDAFNLYLVIADSSDIAGFVSITPPGNDNYSIDKYFSREKLPFRVTKHLFEVRLLTVLKSYRGLNISALLMYAAMRWVDANGGREIAAIGRSEIIHFYEKAGLQPSGLRVKSGAVEFELVHATVENLNRQAERFRDMRDRLERRIDWQLPVSFRKPASCFHGGSFFRAVGERFESLERSREIINADVLDAWFGPSPRVLDAVREYLPWLLRTSPPTDSSGLVHTISEVRGVRPEAVLPGAGSSDLIYLALNRWLSPSSRVLLLDPTYGEYLHVMEKVVRCAVDRFTLSRDEDYRIDPQRLRDRLQQGYDLVVLVNPNSPTGQHLPKQELTQIIKAAPVRTRFWVDETYVEYCGADQSLEPFAAQSWNTVVCKSMSKVYALSGVRAAYLCGPPFLLEELRAFTPPWAVSLPAQLAAVRALEDPHYYAEKHAETHALRRDLSDALSDMGLDVLPGQANLILAHLPPSGPKAERLVNDCRRHNLFLRDASGMGSRLGDRAVRIAVKDRQTNERMKQIIHHCLLDFQKQPLSAGLPSGDPVQKRQ